MGLLIPGLSSKQAALFFHKLHTSYAAGIPIVRCLRLVGEGKGRGNPAARLGQEMADCIERGATLGQAAHWLRRELPLFAVVLIEVGEKTGTLDKALETLAQYHDDISDLKRRLWQQVSYPICVILAATIFVPLLRLFLASVANQTVVPPAHWLGTVLGALGVNLAPLGLAALLIVVRGLEPFVLLALVTAVLSRLPKARQIMLAIAYALPLSGHLLWHFAVFRFARSMELLSGAGYPPHRSIALAARAAAVPQMASDFAGRAEAVLHGLPVAQAFAESRYLSGDHKALMETAEVTGTHDQAFGHIARDERDKAITALRGLIACVGGLFIVVIALLSVFG